MRAVIVTGDRHAEWRQWSEVVDQALGSSHVFVIHGGANGIDGIASDMCNRSDFRSSLALPAQWKRHGTSAGPRRNEAMLSILRTLRDHGYDIAVYAFHDNLESSKGTKHMVNIAVNAAVETWHFTSDLNEPQLRLDLVELLTKENANDL
jgi:hypothetical protein